MKLKNTVNREPVNPAVTHPLRRCTHRPTGERGLPIGASPPLSLADQRHPPPPWPPPLPSPPLARHEADGKAQLQLSYQLCRLPAPLRVQLTRPRDATVPWATPTTSGLTPRVTACPIITAVAASRGAFASHEGYHECRDGKGPPAQRAGLRQPRVGSGCHPRHLLTAHAGGGACSRKRVI